MFISVAELIVTFGPIDQVGCFSACSSVTLRIASSDHVRNGPPEAVRTMRRTSSRRPALKRLENRVVLGIDRQHRCAGGRRAPHEQCAGADQALLVGERHRRAALGGGQRRLQAGRAGDRCHDPVGGTLRRFDHRGGAGGRFDAGAGEFSLEFAIGIGIGYRGKARAEFARKTRQRRAIAMRGDRLDPVAAGIAPQQIDRARTDRAGGAEQRHRARRGASSRSLANGCVCFIAPTITASREPEQPFPAAAIPISSAASAATRKPSRRSISPP